MAKVWDVNDDVYLRFNYERMTAEDMAEVVGCTPEEVEARWNMLTSPTDPQAPFEPETPTPDFREEIDGGLVELLETLEEMRQVALVARAQLRRGVGGNATLFASTLEATRQYADELKGILEDIGGWMGR